MEKAENKNGLFSEIDFERRILTKLTLMYHFQYDIIKTTTEVKMENYNKFLNEEPEVIDI